MFNLIKIMFLLYVSVSIMKCSLDIPVNNNSSTLAQIAKKVEQPTVIEKGTLFRTEEKAKYYLLETRKLSKTRIGTLHKRVGIDSVGYTVTELNCKTKKIRTIGYSEVSEEAIQRNPSSWYNLVEGSSKSDLFNFVCK